MKDRQALRLDIAGVLLTLAFCAVPLLSSSPLYYSLSNQILIGLMASFGVYIMLRLHLLPFTVPACMAMGGYAAAMCAKAGVNNLLVLVGVSFLVPALIAIPLGALVLRLRGVYFVLVTFVFNEILQLILFETPEITGGSNGIAGVPAAELFALALDTPRMVVLVTIATALLAALITLAVTHRFRPEFASLEENETLAESLGLAAWRYRTIAFVVSSGVSGLAGFALVNMLLTAHPNSFSSFSSVDYIAYAIIGGRATMLGPVVGASVLVCMSSLFSGQGQYSVALFGLLLVFITMLAPTGFVGAGLNLVRKITRRTTA